MSHPSSGEHVPTWGATGDLWSRALQHAPAAVAVVTGASHALLYANAAFQGLAAADQSTFADDAPAGEARRPVACGVPVGATLSSGIASALLAILDRVRASGRAERGVLAVASEWRTGDPAPGDAWPYMAWPVEPGTAAGSRPAPTVADARAGAGLPPLAPDLTSLVVIAIDASAASARARVQHRDVTGRVLLSAFREEERADAADAARVLAEEASATRGQFLAATSHELRTPLQAISGYADLLGLGLRGPLTGGQHDALERIQQAGRHLLHLTTALLDYVRLEGGRITYAIAVVPVDTTVQEAVVLVAPQAAARGVTITVVPGAGAPAVRADAGRFRQVLVNLLANAVKFTASGGSITVSSAPAAGGKADMPPRVAIRVTDTGCGIPADQLARIFEPYVQVGRRATDAAGVGLGLAISRALAHDMGGELTAESTVGVGSTFTVTLLAAE